MEDPIVIAEYKSMRNNLTNRINKLKQAYYKKKIDGCNKDPKKIWNNINELTGKKLKQSIDEVCKKNFKENNLKLICNKFNNNFVHTVQQLTLKRKYRYKESGMIKKNSNKETPVHSMVIEDATIEEICNIISGIKNTKAAGIDGVIIEHIKGSKFNSSIMISKLIEKIVQQEKWPSELKIQVLRPVYKKE